jgi:hypothetical protein
MNTCYKNGEPLTDKNRSVEHVIPDFLGGRLKSSDLLCNGCNSEFGNTIDAELSKQLGFAADIIVKIRDREKFVRVYLEGVDGRRIPVGQGLMPQPKITIKLPGKEKEIVFYAKDMADAYAQIEQKKKELEKKYGEFKLTETTEFPTTERLYLKNEITEKAGEIVFGGVPYFRGIGKIMLNFTLYKLPNIKMPMHLLDFVNGKRSDTPVFLYHPSHYQVCQTGEVEFSHVLHIKSDRDERVLYCYLELFNFEKYLCVLDFEYDGIDVDITYCYDLLKGVEFQKPIAVKITREHLKDLKFISNGHKKQREAAYLAFEKRLELLQTIS